MKFLRDCKAKQLKELRQSGTPEAGQLLLDGQGGRAQRAACPLGTAQAPRWTISGLATTRLAVDCPCSRFYGLLGVSHGPGDCLWAGMPRPVTLQAPSHPLAGDAEGLCCVGSAIPQHVDLRKCYFGDYRFSEDLDFSTLKGIPTGNKMEGLISPSRSASPPVVVLPTVKSDPPNFR